MTAALSRLCLAQSKLFMVSLIVDECSIAVWATNWFGMTLTI